MIRRALNFKGLGLSRFEKVLAGIGYFDACESAVFVVRGWLEEEEGLVVVFEGGESGEEG